MTPAEYAKAHQKAFRSAFDFLKSHFPPVDSDDWWLKLAQDSGDLSAACGEDPLTVQLVSGIINYLDRECKARGDDSGETVDN